MKLNPDCIRAVMLEIEKTWNIESDGSGGLVMDSLDITSLYPKLPNYTEEDIFYSLYNLDQAGYVDLEICWACGRVMVDCYIKNMTYAGHEFLDSIRDSKRWSVIKKGMSAVGNFSLSAISALAEGMTSGAVSAFLNRQP